MIKGATPIPFKLPPLTLQKGQLDFIHMITIRGITASSGRALGSYAERPSVHAVGFLFWKFGRPIKAFIDKYLPWVTAGFLILVAGGFVAFAMLSGGSGKAGDACSGVTTMEQVFRKELIARFSPTNSV